MYEWLILGLIVRGRVGQLVFVVAARQQPSDSVWKAVCPANQPTDIGSSPELLLGDLTPALAGQTPMTEKDRTDLQRELIDAGYYRPTAVMEYAALRAVLVIVPLLAAAVVGRLRRAAADSRRRHRRHCGRPCWATAFRASSSIIWPAVRTRQVERGLPVALDLMTLGLSAGLTILASLRRVALELKKAYPVLAYELEIVEQQAELRSLEHALQQLSDRVRIPEIRNLALILVQSERLGTDIGSRLAGVLRFLPRHAETTRRGPGQQGQLLDDVSNHPLPVDCRRHHSGRPHVV